MLRTQPGRLPGEAVGASEVALLGDGHVPTGLQQRTVCSPHSSPPLLVFAEGNALVRPLEML